MQIWIVGLVERDTDRLMLVPVRCDSYTLQTIIAQFMVKGPTVYTDGWAGYVGLNDIGYKHFAVNHTEIFACEFGENVKVHNNTIEGAWNHANVSIICSIKTLNWIYLKKCITYSQRRSMNQNIVWIVVFSYLLIVIVP